MGDEHTGDVQAAIDAVERLSEVEEVVEGAVVSVPSGRKLESLKEYLDEFLERPERREGRAAIEELDSFVDYVNRFKDDNSCIFDTEGGGSRPALQAVIDHHLAGPPGPDMARFGNHRAMYPFPLSDEWTAWHGINGQALSQAAFAEFLEDQLLDIIDPGGAGESATLFSGSLGLSLANPAALLELSKGLAVRVSLEASQEVSLGSGESTLSFQERHSDSQGKPLTVPGGFVVGIPVFQHGARYQVCARLRYRLDGGRVTWTVALHRPELVFRHAFGEACELVANETGLSVFRGSPEV